MSSRAVMRGLGSVLSSSGRAAKLLILTYHRVLAAADPLLNGDVDAATFDWQMSLLARQFTVMSLTEAASRLVAGTLPARAVCITFDDGYADNVVIALPILRRHNLSATFFIATGFLDGGRMWNDTVIETVRQARGDKLDFRGLGLEIYSVRDAQARRQTLNELLNQLKYLPVKERTDRAEALATQTGASLPDDLMMSSEQVLELQTAGMAVGAHTVNHPILMRLGLEEAEREIRLSRTRLQTLGIRNVTAFAYPNGRPLTDYDRNHVQAVRSAGFEVAVSTAWGCARGDMDPLQLPRIAPWDDTPKRFYLRLLKAYFDRAPIAA